MVQIELRLRLCDLKLREIINDGYNLTSMWHTYDQISLPYYPIYFTTSCVNAQFEKFVNLMWCISIERIGESPWHGSRQFYLKLSSSISTHTSSRLRFLPNRLFSFCEMGKTTFSGHFIECFKQRQRDRSARGDSWFYAIIIIVHWSTSADSF